MSWKKNLPNQRIPAKIKAVTVRPDPKTGRWLADQARLHNVSVNRIVLAIIRTAAEEGSR